MKLGIKEIAGIAVALLLSAPLVYLLMLFVTDNARIQFGPRSREQKQEESVKLVKASPLRDSLLAQQSKTFQAVAQERQEVGKMKEQVQAERDRVEMARKELETQRTQLAAEREKMEKLVAQTDELDKKRMAQIAKMYGAMKPAEAARIIETLDDDQAIKIITAIGDDRQKAKILSSLAGDRAARLTAKMGKPVSAAR